MKEGRELDELVTTHVMEWSDLDEYYRTGGTFKPSTNISDAWQVVEKMKDGDNFVNLYNTITKEWYCKIETTDKKKFAVAETAPLAICYASLKAVGYEIEKVEGVKS